MDISFFTSLIKCYGLTCIERRRRPLGVGGRGHGELPQHPQLLQLDVVGHVRVVQKPPAAGPSSN